MKFFKKAAYLLFMVFFRYVYNWIIILGITVTFIREKVWKVK